MMAFAMVASVATPAITADAAGLTQATAPDQVKYGKLTAAEKKVLASIFDVEFYKAQNPELVEKLGSDYDKLFEHFCLCGIFEGRTCNANFDPSAYASAYSDLKAQFGTDIIKYYEHYVAFAAKEDRTITTIAACAEKGITVESLAVDTVKITPAAYQIALKLGTTDFSVVQNAVNRAAEIAAQNNSGGGVTIVATTSKVDELIAKAAGLTFVGTVGTNAFVDSSSTGTETASSKYQELKLYIVKADSAYAAYRNNEDENKYFTIDTINEFKPVYYTDGYDASTAENVSWFGEIIVAPREKGTSSSSGSSEEYDPTGDEYYEYEDEGEVSEKGNRVDVYQYAYSGEGYKEAKEVEQEGTNIWKTTGTLAGYYSDENYTKHPFASEEEKQQYLADYETNYKAKMAKEYPSEATTSSGYVHIPDEEYKYSQVQDPNGNKDTTYNVGMEIKENEDGNVNVTVGIYNEDNEFAYIGTYGFEKTEEK